mgnify:CR=1 FL=1
MEQPSKTQRVQTGGLREERGESGNAMMARIAIADRDDDMRSASSAPVAHTTRRARSEGRARKRPTQRDNSQEILHFSGPASVVPDPRGRALAAIQMTWSETRGIVPAVPISTPIASSSLGGQAGDSLITAPGSLAEQVITMPPTAEILQDTMSGTIYGAPTPMALPAPNPDGTLATATSSGMFGWIMAAGTGIANMIEDTPMADGGLAPANPDDDPKDIFDREMEVSELLSRRYREEAQDCIQQRNEIRRQAEIMASQSAEMQRKCTAEVEELRRMTAMHCQSNNAITMQQLQQARDSAKDAQAIANNRVASLEVICQQRDANLASEFEAAVVIERQKALDAVAVEQSNSDRLRNDIVGLQEAAIGYQKTVSYTHLTLPTILLV